MSDEVLNARSPGFLEAVRGLLGLYPAVVLEACLSRTGGVRNVRLIEDDRQLLETIEDDRFFFRPQALISVYRPVTVPIECMVVDRNDNTMHRVDFVYRDPSRGDLLLTALVPAADGSLTPGAY